MKKTNLKVICWLLWFCTLLQLQHAYGQNLTKAEYFFDIDPGIGMGVPITGINADTITGYTFTANVSGLTSGYHYMYLRVMDTSNNLWSTVVPQLFFLNPLEAYQFEQSYKMRLSKAEYFIDADPGVGKGNPMFIFSGDSINQSYTINTAALAIGNHIIGIRVMDIGGYWSIAGCNSFKVINTSCSPPNAFFTSDTVNVGNISHFTNLSTNITDSTFYLWKVIKANDTITGTTKDFSYTFPYSGYYDVILKVSNSDTCTSYWREKVMVGPLLSRQISITGNTEFCDKDSVSLLAPLGSNYLWNTGDTTRKLIAKTSAIYQVSYVDLYNNYVVSNQVKVTVHPVLNLIVDISPANNGLANGSAIALASGGSRYYYDYSWSGGEHTMMAAQLASGNYSVEVTDGKCPVSKNFFVPNLPVPPHGIIYAEYYIDDISLPPHSFLITYDDTINCYSNISLTGISPGYHYLYVRVKDTSGLWSTMSMVSFGVSIFDSLFSQPEPIHHIVKAEYFYDNIDPGTGKGIPLPGISSLDSIDQAFSIILPDTLTQGFHYVAFRVFDDNYGWSVAYTNLFYAKPANDPFPPEPDITLRIVEAEYFYDSDPGIRKGKPLFILPGDSVNMIFTTDLTGLQAGSHKICIRVKDLSNKWSVIKTASFTIASPVACTTPIPDFVFTTALAGQPIALIDNSSQINNATIYEWDVNNDNISEYSGSTCSHTFQNPGAYPVELTVNNGGNCISTRVYYVTIGAELPNFLTVASATDFCYGDSVILTAPLGSNYQWTNGGSTRSIVAKTSGYYQAVYTDLNGISRQSDIIQVIANPKINVLMDIDNASNGLANGSAGAFASGGSSWVYNYLFSTGETLQTAVNLGAGNYFVTINDSRCSVTKDFTVANINITSGIIYGEYYIDTIPDMGVSYLFNVGQGDTIGSYFHIPLTGLPIGMHYITVRLRESTGLWTIPWKVYFYINDSIPISPNYNEGLISKAEYFFDNDPGTGNGFPIAVLIPADTINYNLIVPTTGLHSGFHSVSLRVRNDNGNWSSVLSHNFYVISDSVYTEIDTIAYPIILAEYFIDTDPGQGNATTINVTPGMTLNEYFSINTSGLDTGYHYIGVRVKDLRNIWGAINAKTINIVPPNGCETPYPDFTFTQANAGMPVNFTNLSTNVNVNTQYFWYISTIGSPDFTTLNASHVYPTPGIYDVKLTVSNGSNCQSTIIKEVIIGPLLSNVITANGNLEFCYGDSVILTAPLGSDYFWPGTDTTRSITVKQSGIYHAIYTDIYGNVRLTNAVQVIVNPRMNITSTVCYSNNGLPNGSAGVSVSGGNSFAYSYLWSTGATVPSVSALVPGIYSVLISDNVCPETKTLIVPNLIGDVTGIIAAEYFFDIDPGPGLGTAVPISMGDSINSYVNANTTGLTIGMHNLLLRVKHETGIWSIVANQSIFITPPVVFTPDTDTLPSIVAVEYFYNTDPGIGNGTPITISNPASVLDLTTGISTQGTNFGTNILAVRVMDSYKKWGVIYGKSFMLCNPSSMPVAGADTAVCEGLAFTLKSSNVSGATYYWTGPNGFTSTVQNPVIDTLKAIHNGYYKVFSVNNGNCYSPPDSIKLEVREIPAKPGLITGNMETCLSDSVVFYVPVITAATYYNWNFTVPHTILANYNTNSVAVRFDTSMASIPITVRGQSVYCGLGPLSDTFYITANSQLPSAAGIISGISTVCQGRNNVEYSVPLIANAASYEWIVPSGVSIVSGQGSRTIYVNFSSNAVSGNIQVNGKNSCGNGSPSSFYVTVNILPAVSQANYADICLNGSNILLNTGIPAGGIYSGNGIQNGVFNPTVAGIGIHSIKYVYTSSYGCKDSSSAYITVVPIITEAGIITGPAYVCQKSTENTYYVSPVTNATSYTWTLPNGFTGQSTTNSIVVNIDSLAVNGYITVKGNNFCGNGAESSFYVRVNPYPTVIQPAIAQTRCSNGSISFNAKASTGSVLQWSIDNFLNIAVVGDTFIIPNIQIGSTLVTYRAINLVTGCESSVYTTTGTAFPLPVANAGADIIVCSGDTVRLVATGGISYQWNNGVVQNTPFIPEYTNNYIVQASNQFNCSSSDTVLVSVKNKMLIVHAILEGLFANNNLMNNALNELSEPQWGYEVADKVIIEIRDETSPYIIIATDTAFLRVNSEIKMAVDCQTNASYYIVIRNRNHLETWSSIPVSFAGDTITYDFTNAASKAYESNQKQVSQGKFAIMVGDANQDGIIDLSDLVAMDTDLTMGNIGYIVNDLNGDGLVDLSDLVTIDENLTNGAVVMTP